MQLVWLFFLLPNRETFLRSDSNMTSFQVSAVSVQSKPPLCAVLMATCNGASFLDEQLKSIQNQSNVSVNLIISDDHSTDNSIEIIEAWKPFLPIQFVSRIKDTNSNSNKNFLSLIASADIGSAEFVALSDQDDLWDHDKLSCAIERLKALAVDIYSGDVIAFWPGGRKKLIKKSYPKKRYDHLFGSPGPGCTFVFKRSAFLSVQEWIKQNHTVLATLWIHDWSIYCYARESGLKWVIDSSPRMLYRQHASNVIGANIGFSSWIQRFNKVLSGEYRYNIISLCELTHGFPECVKALQRINWSDRLWLISRAKEFRRSRLEVWVLRFMLLFMPNEQMSVIFSQEPPLVPKSKQKKAE